MRHDVLVVGAGPAGLAMAAALCQAGLNVALLAPGLPDALWPNTYGIWLDEIEALGLADTLAYQWPDTVVYFDDQPHRLGRTYALIDNGCLQAHLLAIGERAGMRCYSGTAVTVAHRANGSLVTMADGSTYEAGLVVDASGHFPVLLRQPKLHDVAFQAAYGLVGRFSAPPVQAGQCVLMDYRDEHLSAAERQSAPTFLYAMDLGEGRYFVEETSLAQSPGMKMAALQDRLERRLAGRGITAETVEHVEQCYFPMNAPLPEPHQQVVGFGAAAGLVHPASGYSVGASLRYAPRVAGAIANTLGAAGATPREASRAAWAVLWPPGRLRTRALYLFGLAALLGCPPAVLRQFFATFYRLPQPEWTGYLADTLPPRAVAACMLHLFVRAPARVRSSLIRSALGESRLLLQALRRSGL